jgi:5-formyltetrahydrofolate cyclo-ligase
VSSADLKKAKREVRRRVLALRDETTPREREVAAAAVAVRCLELPEVTEGRVAMVFWSFGSELPTMPIIESLVGAGKLVALPRIVDGDLQVRTWRPGEPMSTTPFGAMEPVQGTIVPPAEVDVVFTPAVAFDRRGRRVGYGGGFYDRFFPKTGAARVGVCLALQVLDEPLPAGHFDLRVQVLVTEESVIRIEDPGAG